MLKVNKPDSVSLFKKINNIKLTISTAEQDLRLLTASTQIIQIIICQEHFNLSPFLRQHRSFNNDPKE